MMHPLQFVLVGVLSAAVAQATIAIGVQFRNDGSQRNLAWLKGDDACAAAFLSVSPANPCGHVFSTGGYSGLTLEGCGGSNGLWLDENGQFNHDCVANDDYSKICNSGKIQKTYEC